MGPRMAHLGHVDYDDWLRFCDGLYLAAIGDRLHQSPRWTIGLGLGSS